MNRSYMIHLKYFALAIVILLLNHAASADELLYNGIRLLDQWPPQPKDFPRAKPITPPYLVNPPKVIPIDVGRQLFVDDFLIAKSTLKRTFHQPKYHPSCPVLKPQRPWEIRRDSGFAAPFSDGVWFDPKDRTFKMWYMGGTITFFCYATSTDGIRWTRAKLNEFRPKGSNILNIQPIQRDSSTVWLNLEAKDPAKRYVMAYYRSGLITRFSADGIRWSKPIVTHRTGDRSTFFYNPFRKVWVYSIRAGRRNVGRCRYYAETRDLTKKCFETTATVSRWTCADMLDRVRPIKYVDNYPDLYNLDATPYESLMLGLFTIHSHKAVGGRPKINHVTLGYSRDGFHWHRPDRRPFLDVSDDKDAWNYGNVQSAGGGCLIVGDRLYFYCSGRNPRKPRDDGSGASTGLAVLRRDGFASLDAGNDGGVVTTRPITFKGKHLFVNVDCPNGNLRMEVLNENGVPFTGLSRADAIPLSADKTRVQVKWKGGSDLRQLAGKTVCFRFHLTNGKLYSFWVSPNASGASHGYVAAGGPGFTSNRDTVGAGSP